MEVKRILYIAPHSFPIHSSESIVNAKLAFALAQAGYHIDVFSTKEDGLNYPISNSELFLLTEPNLSINIIDFQFVNRKLGFYKNISLLFEHLLCFIKTGFVFNGSNLSYKTIKAIEKKIKVNGNYDLLITRGYRTEIIGIYFKKRSKIKWIANWNDPYPEIKFPPPYGMGFDTKLDEKQERILKNILNLVDIHTFPCERLRDYMLQYFVSVNKTNTYVMPHMAHSLFIPNIVEKRSKVRIVHAGNVSSPRSPNNFLFALERVVNDLNYKHKIDCVFIGKQTDDFDKKIYELGLGEYVTILPPLDYFSMLNELSKSDVSLIIEAICDEGIYLPTKVVDSFQCKLPIFCISPSKGTLNDLVKNNNVGYFSDNSSIKNIELNLVTMINDWENKKLPIIDVQQLSNFFENDIVKSYSFLFKQI